jgi:ElaA protein
MNQHWETLSFDQLSTTQLYKIMQLRQRVFVVEQDCIFLDLDDLDQCGVHILCWRGSELIAYQRCLPPGQGFIDSALGRIAVAPEARGIKLGQELVQRGIDHNFSRWPDNDIQIGAQAHLIDFYANLGFVSCNDEYVEDGIPHIHMIKSR